jgi:replicative DNA helicase
MGNNTTLTQFGPTFQSKIITSLLLDKKFFQTISDILESKYFDSDANRFLVTNIRDYFHEYKTTPTLEVLKVKINAMDDDILQVSVIENLKEAWKYIESTDLEFVKTETIEFCKNQVLKNAILESVNLLELRKYDDIKKIIDEAMKAGTERDLGHDYTEGLDERLANSARDVVETPWDPINELMDGGLGKGELGVVVAPAGIGKSWLLQSIGAHGIKKGLTVVYYTLELNQNYVGLRFDTIISGIPTANIKFHKEEVERKINTISGKLVIKYYPTRSATVPTLAAHLKQMELQGIDPDLVLVDYADILRDTSNYKEMRHQLGSIYEDLRGLAGEIDCPIWTASQANRSSLDEDVIDASKVAEAYSKVMTADFIISISRKVDDKISNTARAHVIKNRFGLDGITYPMNMNTNIGKIDIYEDLSAGGKIAQKKMDSRDDVIRKTLATKYKDFKTTTGFE